ncbi:transcriptional regulator, AraC family [Chitinophaga pinensis DSM 2588]|uniref:Transcriptional regulator, AraC family n=2 Tax=Chitinophaga pinensis TaxID=79329 RepID=A0A979G4S1_CHIPD|nr:transcriptional regulator, AraC family [Chitinophaga pinensis DSM 2588]
MANGDRMNFADFTNMVPLITSSFGNNMIEHTSLNKFYQRATGDLPDGIGTENGHFNVFEIEKLYDKKTGNRIMPYSRRDYYKVSLIRGHSRAEYADKVIEIEDSALLFATPRIPYHWVPVDSDQTGMFCIFTAEFLSRNNAGVFLDELPIFKPGALPVFKLTPEAVAELEYIFRKMLREIASDYVYKYDLLRNLLQEIIHYGQKLQPMSVLTAPQNAADRISSLFVELLERQFPLESQHQRLELRTAKDYADRLAVHVNHLNKVLKAKTGRTTTDIISDRITQEAKILLKKTDWSVYDIGYTLGFDDLAHFSNFFKKHAKITAQSFRS